MRAIVAKRIRRDVYGDHSSHVKKHMVGADGSCHADDRRKTYQRLKKEHVRS